MAILFFVILSLSLNLTILRLYLAILFFCNSEFEFKSHNSTFISGNSFFVVSLSLNLTILRLYLAIQFFCNSEFEFKSHNSTFISGNSIFL